MEGAEVTSTGRGPVRPPVGGLALAVSMSDVQPISKAEALQVLRSEKCACGLMKRAMSAFCRPCYLALTPSLQAPLYDRVGAGFERAYAEASRWLGARAAQVLAMREGR